MDSGAKWGTEEKQTGKRVRGRRVEGSFALSPFSLPFLIYLLQVNNVHSFYGIYIYIQLERRALFALCYWSAGTDLVVLTFQLLLDCETVIFFFLVFILLFFLCQFLSYFLDVFFAFLPSLTQSSHHPPSAPDKGERPFAPDPSFDYSTFLAYAKCTGCFVVWQTLYCSTF